MVEDKGLARTRLRLQFEPKLLLEGLLKGSIKGEVKKKHIACGGSFSCYPAHVIERDLFRPAAPWSRALGTVAPVVWVSSTSGFHRLFATKPVSSETSKAERWSGANHGSIGDSWPIAFSGCPRGPRVGCETGVPRGTHRLTFQLRLALEPECLENRMATAREDPQDGADSVRDTQAVCGFRNWASKCAPFFQISKVIAAILRARVSRAISGLIPLASRAA